MHDDLVQWKLAWLILTSEILDKTTARSFIAPRRQGAKLRMFSEFSELGVFASLRESSLFRFCNVKVNGEFQICLVRTHEGKEPKRRCRAFRFHACQKTGAARLR